eukprot:15333657-Ditylum_brightwellii.AAC.1
MGRTFLIAHEVDGSVHHAEVMHPVESMDGKTEQYLVYLGNGKRKKITAYDAIAEVIDKQLTSEAEKTHEEFLWMFEKDV